jgi:hypothetical protein
VINRSRTVQAGDPDPLGNTVTLTCSPEGFPNVLTASASHSVDLLHPSYTVSKVCQSEPVPAAGPAIFDVHFVNTGDVDLIVTADDGIGTFTLGAGQSQSFAVSVPGPFGGTTVENTVNATATLPAWTGLPNVLPGSATGVCQVQQNQGCTPGYWKNHLEQWAATGYSPTDDFDTTFGTEYFDPDITLEQAVNLGGGGVERLARHGVAALLSAAHPGVNYPLTVDQVIAAVQAGDADTLEAFNEAFCPLN